VKKDKDGRIVLKESFFLRYLWWTNLWRFIIRKKISVRDDEPSWPNYPKNLCFLFWGSILAPICWIPTIVVAIGILLAFVVVLILVVSIIFVLPSLGILFGFVPEYDGSDMSFYPYRRYSYMHKKKIWAPWWFWLPGLLVWLLIRRHFSIFGSVSHIFANNYFLIAMGIGVVIAMIFIFFLSTPGRIFVEFIKATKKKICPLITIEK
jgi:uncharacterized membrane protein